MLKFESMHSLHFAISTLLSTCFLGYDGSRAVFTGELGSVNVGRNFLSAKGGMLCMRDLVLTSFEKELSVTGLNIDFRKVNCH